MIISIIYWIGAAVAFITAALIEGFGPLLINTAEDKRGLHMLTCAMLIVGGLLIYGGFDAAN